jgi:hypothetical protein
MFINVNSLIRLQYMMFKSYVYIIPVCLLSGWDRQHQSSLWHCEVKLLVISYKLMRPLRIVFRMLIVMRKGNGINVLVS